jgi:Leucine-rich repeat (LRR) protein
MEESLKRFGRRRFWGIVLAVLIVAAAVSCLAPLLRPWIAFARLSSFGPISLPGWQGTPGYGLNFHHSKIQDDDLALILKLRPSNSISILDLNRTGITDRGLKHLRPLTNLPWLMLIETRVTDEGLAELRDLKAMRRLYLDGTQVTDAGLAHLANMVEMRSLLLSGTRITDAGLAQLHGMKNLRNLFVEETDVTLSGLRALNRELPQLEQLIFSTERVFGTPRLRQLKAELVGNRELELVSVNLTKNPAGKEFDDGDLAQLAELASLTQLVLDGTQVTAVSAELIGRFRLLKYLSLRNTRIDDRVLMAIRGLENLEALYLDGTDVTDIGLEHLQTLPKLAYLGLSDTKVSDSGMAAIANIGLLEN